MAEDSEQPDRPDGQRFRIPDGKVKFRLVAEGKARRFTCPLINIDRGGLAFLSPVEFAPLERIVLTVNTPHKTNYLKLIAVCDKCRKIVGREAYSVDATFDRYGASIEQRLTHLEMRYGFLAAGEADEPEHAAAGQALEGEEGLPAHEHAARPLPADIPPKFTDLVERFEQVSLDHTTVDDVLDVVAKGADFDELLAEREGADRSDVVRALVPVFELGESSPAAFDTLGVPVGEPFAYVFLPNLPHTPAFSLQINRDAALSLGPPRFAQGDLLFFGKDTVQDLDHALVVTDNETVFGQVIHDAEDELRVRPPNEQHPERRFHKQDIAALWRLTAKVEHF